MKAFKKKISIYILVALVTICSFIAANNVYGNELDTGEDKFAFIQITDAYYGNFDSDGFEDDIRVHATIESEYIGSFTFELYLDIVLPSGIAYHFTFIETIDKTDEEFDIVITTFNTATEAGWYQAILTGEFFANYDSCYDTDIIEFDPPTGKGEGNPTATLDVVS